jgi:hypothetical protein
MKKNKHINLIGSIKFPERSSHLNKAFWVEVLQDKNLTLQSIDDNAKSQHLHNQRVAHEYKVDKKFDELNWDFLDDK